MQVSGKEEPLPPHQCEVSCRRDNTINHEFVR